MNDFAKRVIRQMSRREKAAVLGGNSEPATWLAAKMFKVNDAQAERIAEAVIEQLSAGKA